MFPFGMSDTEEARIGRYELEAKIAQGGMAEIFLARQPGIGGFSRRVVLKCILPLLAEEPRFVEMFLEEARLASLIHHTNVVQIFDVGEDDDHYYIAMEHIDGLPIGDLMTLPSGELKPLPIDVACEIIMQACSGLHAAHRLRDEDGQPLGLVHRDVSPQNLMVNRDGVVKLVDFGIAKAQDSSVTTRTGSIKGKYAYMSPEQVRGQPLDRRSDIFSLGTLLHELLTGQRLFHRNAELAILVAIIEDPFPVAHDVNPEVPEELSEVILRALQRDKQKRYSTAAEMGSVLREVAGNLGHHTSADTLSRYIEQECREQLQTRKGPSKEFASTPSIPDIDDLPQQVPPKKKNSGLGPASRDLDDVGEWDDAPTNPKESMTYTRSLANFPEGQSPRSPLGSVQFPAASDKEGGAGDSQDAIPTQPEADSHAPSQKSRLVSAQGATPQGVQLLTKPVEEIQHQEGPEDDEGDTRQDRPELLKQEVVHELDRPSRRNKELSKTIDEDGPPPSMIEMPGPPSPKIEEPRISAPSWIDEVPGLRDEQKGLEKEESEPTADSTARVRVSQKPTHPRRAEKGEGGSSSGLAHKIVWLALIVFVLGGVSGLLLFLHSRNAHPSGPPLVYAHPPSLSEKTLVKALQPLADYLEQELDRPVQVVTTPNYQALRERLLSGEVHVANLSPLLYIQARKQHPGLEALVSHSSGGTTKYQSYIVARSNSKIRTFEQLEGKSFCFTDTNSTSGYLLPRSFLRSKGLDPDEIFSTTRISGNHEAVLEDIIAGKCDAGAVSSIAWLGARELIGAKSAQIVSVGPAGETTWDVVCASPKLPAKSVAAIKRALLEFEPQKHLGRQWISPVFTVDRFVPPPEDFSKTIDFLEQAAIAEKLLD